MPCLELSWFQNFLAHLSGILNKACLQVVLILLKPGCMTFSRWGPAIECLPLVFPQMSLCELCHLNISKGVYKSITNPSLDLKKQCLVQISSFFNSHLQICCSDIQVFVGEICYGLWPLLRKYENKKPNRNSCRTIIKNLLQKFCSLHLEKVVLRQLVSFVRREMALGVSLCLPCSYCDACQSFGHLFFTWMLSQKNVCPVTHFLGIQFLDFQGNRLLI